MTHRAAEAPRRFGIQLTQLFCGNLIMGTAVALLLRARLGLLPLDVLHSAIAQCTGWTIGGAIIATQAVLLAAYLPARIRPGIGTVATSVIPAVVCDVVLAYFPPPTTLGVRIVLLIAGGALFAAGVALYLGSGLGELPRDGLMRALQHRRGWNFAAIRVSADVLCLVTGWLLIGPSAALTIGAVGAGSILLATGLGPSIARLITTDKPVSQPVLRVVPSPPPQGEEAVSGLPSA